jgi:alpha-L-arabinofuranosidase
MYVTPNMHTFSFPRLATVVCLLSVVCCTTVPARAADASLRVLASQRSPHPVPPLLTGKFTEHLYNNIYHGIDAQTLWNPTFAPYPFSTGQNTPDGVATFHWDRDKIGEAIRRQAARMGWPEEALPALIDAYNDGLACGWTRVGARDEVVVSPEVAPFGQRAQRVELRTAGGGVAQWTYLPLHRVRTFEYAIYLRALDVAKFTVALHRDDSEQPIARAVMATSEEWRELRGKLVVPDDAPADLAYRFSITTDAPGQLVIAHAFLCPADHVGGADPDVVRLLKEAHIPIHRWPGGNFVSGYHWRDGVGPIEQRPTAPNLAWGQPEPNTFGTDEFIALCRATESEPMICVNAGSGTPEEAAQWIEYCNGSTATPLGKLRAANGHADPYNVKHWEVGNELWGRWQVNWTTGIGYADRFKRFAAAMLAVDPSIKLYACGASVQSNKRWNDALIGAASGVLRATTDHPLIGGSVPPSADPLDVFRDFMAVPDMLEIRWAALAKQMGDAGIREPRLAITELQMFASIGRVTNTAAPARITSANLVSPGTLAEALYDVLFYHSAVRLAPFVEMVTHSATVNHGGGLRKERERVYANPCYYAQAAFHDFLGATPVAIEVQAPIEQSPRVLSGLRNLAMDSAIKTVDAIAAVTPDGDLLLSIVHRAGSGSTRLVIEVSDFAAEKSAEVRMLSGEVPWEANTLAEPSRIKPVDRIVDLERDAGTRLVLELPPYSVLRVRVPKQRAADVP